MEKLNRAIVVKVFTECNEWWSKSSAEEQEEQNAYLATLTPSELAEKQADRFIEYYKDHFNQ